ncbi:alkaline phosphatase [Noviherbaspirillum pedocola]|uniref:Alkaline phosphatase n=1 Tax=Noviherbaspirillum pedocola TaxID=2801341 RepID=A0A934SR36_9BURK|nr:alkaline phosphatase [Noviherbaspirillum pedocola]MBK4733987.1 alkaline phosphatase [Noviherbaspirillum pedocola]
MLRGVAWLAAVCLAGCAGGVARTDEVAPAKPNAAEATRLVLLVGTGLDAKTLAAARAAAGREGRTLAIDSMPARTAIAPEADRAAMFLPLMSAVPHAGAVAAMECGAGASVPPNFVARARSRGLAAGIITTARLTGAVLASTYAPACATDDENALAAMLVPGGPGYNPALGPEGLDLALGGGRLFFLPSALGGKREDGRRLLDELATRDFRIIENIAGFRALDAALPRRVFGLFAWDSVSDEADRDASAEPSLAQMTVKAMALLARNARGFFLLVESGQIGALRREGDGFRAAVEAIALDDALRGARAAAESDDPGLTHTLILLVGDDFAAALGAGADALANARGWDAVHRVIDGEMGRSDAPAAKNAR